MEVRELRIGNLVEKSIKSGQGRTLICKIGCEDIVRVFENIGSFNYNPITLTEEWLLKAGAEAYEFDHKPSQYRIGDRLIVVRDGCFYEYGTNLKLEFVHRFQNLFFELQNGKELEFKL